jgi:hypothetical protein
MKNPVLSFITNLGLLLSGLVTAFSGLLIQINYHMGDHEGIIAEKTVLGINYDGWSGIHKISIIYISFFMVFHIILHWKWYKIIIRKNLITKNRQVIILSILFITAAITGYIPWFISITGGEAATRELFIEIHDKLVLILIVYLILHISKRFKWFITTFDKLRNKAHTLHQV